MGQKTTKTGLARADSLIGRSEADRCLRKNENQTEGGRNGGTVFGAGARRWNTCPWVAANISGAGVDTANGDNTLPHKE